MLKVDKEVLFRVDYNDLDEAITEFLRSKGFLGPAVPGRYHENQYECVDANEWNNDESHTFDVRPELPKDYTIKKFEKGSFSWSTGAILGWMCADGLIEPGEYLVEISW